MKKILFISIVIELLIIVIIGNQIRLKNKKNVLGVFQVSPINHQNLIFPLDQDFKYYYELKPSRVIKDRLFWTADTYANYTINKDGLNDRYNYDILKPKGVFRILALGDSFTFGQFIDTKDNWTERLEDLFINANMCPNIDKFEVINLGMGGFDIPYIVKRFNDYGLKYKPDLIIWLENGSGFTRYNEIMQPYIQECQKSESISSTKLPNEFYKCWRDSEKKMLEKYSPQTITKYLDVSMAKFMELRSSTPTLFAVFQYLSQDQKKEIYSRIKDQQNMFLDESISDIQSKDGTLADGHPNKKGHQSIAQDIYQYITENKKNLMICN